jgi:hypothetical protein
MSLPYTRKRSSPSTKRPKKRPPEPRRVIPEIYVRTRGERDSIYTVYAKAHIRIRRGCYRFLVWREGDKIREFYLGRLGKSAPTSGTELGHLVAGAGEACRSSRRRVRK